MKSLDFNNKDEFMDYVNTYMNNADVREGFNVMVLTRDGRVLAEWSGQHGVIKEFRSDERLQHDLEKT